MTQLYSLEFGKKVVGNAVQQAISVVKAISVVLHVCFDTSASAR